MRPSSKFIYKFVLGGFCFYTLILLLIFFTKPSAIFTSDLPAFLTGARIIISPSRSQIYSVSAQSYFQTVLFNQNLLKPNYLLPFRYLPVFTLLYLPLTLFPYAAAYFLNGFILLSLIFVCLRLIYKYFPHPLLWLFPLTYTPFIGSLLISQPSVILAAVPVLIFHFFMQKQPLISGLSTLLLLLKPQYYAIALPFLLYSYPNKKFLLGILLGFLFVFFTSCLLVGVRPLLSYVNFIISTESSKFGSQSLYFISLPPSLSLLLFPLVFLIFIKVKTSFFPTLVILPFLLCALSPHSFKQDLTILMFSFCVLLNWRPKLTVALFLILNFFLAAIPQYFGLINLGLGLYLLLAIRRPDWQNLLRNVIIYA